MMRRPKDSERRSSARRSIDREVVVEVEGERRSGRLANVGERGAFVQPHMDLKVGDEIVIELLGGKIRAVAGVYRVDPGGIAIRFDDETIGRLVAGWG